MTDSIIDLAKRVRAKQPIGFFSSNELRPVSFTFQTNANQQTDDMNELIASVLNQQSLDHKNVARINEILSIYNTIQVERAQLDNQLSQHEQELFELEKQKKLKIRALEILNNTLSDIQFKIDNPEEQDKPNVLNAQLTIEQDKLNTEQESLRVLEKQLTEKKTEVDASRTNRDAFLASKAHDILQYEQLSKALKEVQDLITTLYSKAITKDIELAKTLDQLRICLGLIACFAALALSCYFIPALVSGIVGVIVGLLPALIVLIVSIIVIIATASANGSSRVPTPDNNTMGLLFKSLFMGGIYVGVGAYHIAYVAMPFVAAILGAATLITSGAAIYFGIKSAILQSSRDDFFEETLLEGLKNIVIKEDCGTEVLEDIPSSDTNYTPL